MIFARTELVLEKTVITINLKLDFNIMNIIVNFVIWIISLALVSFYFTVNIYPQSNKEDNSCIIVIIKMLNIIYYTVILSNSSGIGGG